MPELTAERARELLDYDPETGLLTWRCQRGNFPQGMVAGCLKPHGYIDIQVEARKHKAHRLAWLLTHGIWPTRDIDHINGHRADNRMVNLREVTRSTPLQNQLTAERARELLDYDPETGVFTRRLQRMKFAKGSVAGYSTSLGYIDIGVDRRKYKAHRIAWLITHGSWPVSELDHINGDKTDNRLVNLRESTRSLNIQNTRVARRNNGTGVLGVHWNKKLKKFSAKISVAGKARYLGSFQTAEAAHQAYLVAKRQLHPGNTI